jgi:hypothetical protein
VNFSGQTRYKSGDPYNWVCIYIDYFGPRQIKPSGGGGVGAGNWGFSPCGDGACQGTIKIYVVDCPAGIGEGGLNADQISAAPPPKSDVFTATVTNKCETGQWTNIIFRSNTE